MLIATAGPVAYAFTMDKLNKEISFKIDIDDDENENEINDEKSTTTRESDNDQSVGDSTSKKQQSNQMMIDQYDDYSKSFCQYCLNKSMVSYRINFDESIKLCSNPQCPKYEKNYALSNVITYTTNSSNTKSLYDTNDQIDLLNEFKKDFNIKNVNDLFENEKRLNEFKCYNELSVIMNGAIESVKSLLLKASEQIENINETNVSEQEAKPTATTTISEISEEAITTQPLVNQIDDFSLPISNNQNNINDFDYSLATYDLTFDLNSTNQILNQTNVDSNLTNLNGRQASTNLFDENFFSSIDNLLNEDMIDVNPINVGYADTNQMLGFESDMMIGLDSQHLFDFQNQNLFNPPPIAPLTTTTTTTTTTMSSAPNVENLTLAELKSVDQNMLYEDVVSNDFLNANNLSYRSELDVTPKQQEESTKETSNKQITNEVVSESKSKSGSGIKITRILKNKQDDIKQLILSPTTSRDETKQLEISIGSDKKPQLSPKSLSKLTLGFDEFKKSSTKSESNGRRNKANIELFGSSPDKLLPWEVKSTDIKKKSKKFLELIRSEQTSPSKQAASSPGTSLQALALTKPSSPLLRTKQSGSVTKADLSQKASEQKAILKDRGTLLKKAILEDTNLLPKLTQSASRTNLGTTNSDSMFGSTNKPTGYKDLVLSVLKKKTTTS